MQHWGLKSADFIAIFAKKAAHSRCFHHHIFHTCRDFLIAIPYMWVGRALVNNLVLKYAIF